MDVIAFQGNKTNESILCVITLFTDNSISSPGGDEFFFVGSGVSTLMIKRDPILHKTRNTKAEHKHTLKSQNIPPQLGPAAS